MRFIENITEKEYEEFLKNSNKSHFEQSYQWGKFSQESKNVIPHYVGIKDKNKIVATALLLEKKLLFGLTYLYSPRGFVLDYKNLELIKTFTTYLKNYAKKRHAIFIKFDPDIKLHTLNLNGEVIDDGIDNYELVNYLKKIGYKHTGFNKNFENSSPRYTFRLNIDKSIDEIIDGFHNTTKKIIKKGNPYNLKIIKNDINMIDDFYLTMKETAKRENIAPYNINYYKNFYEKLHEKNMSDLYVVKADIKQLKERYEENINNINKQIKNISSKNKKTEYENQLNKLLKEKKELDKINTNELTLSSIITAKYDNKVWTVHGGNHSLLRTLNSNYLIYFEIIKDAHNEGYKLIDFFGTTGNPDPKNSVYGIHLFKKRLGGEYTEFIGEFNYPIKPVFYFLFNHLIKIRRNAQRIKSKIKNR